MNPRVNAAFHTIVVLVLLGQILEGKARLRTSPSVKALLNRAAKTARVVHAGTEQEIPIAEVQEGDSIRVRPAEKERVDGTIIEGARSLDELMITGGSMPARKTLREPVIGAPLNQTGSFIPIFRLLLSPIIASAAMSLSSVSVVANALRLHQAELGQEAANTRPRGASRQTATVSAG